MSSSAPSSSSHPTSLPHPSSEPASGIASASTSIASNQSGPQGVTGTNTQVVKKEEPAQVSQIRQEASDPATSRSTVSPSPQPKAAQQQQATPLNTAKPTQVTKAKPAMSNATTTPKVKSKSSGSSTQQGQHLQQGQGPSSSSIIAFNNNAPGNIQAYAMLDFDDFTFYVQTMQILLGRLVEGDTTTDALDIHLGPAKAISRRHAKIFYNFGTQRFELSVIGRNGCFVDDIFIETGVTLPLKDKTRIQIGETHFKFVLPSSSDMNSKKKEMKGGDHGNKSSIINPSDAVNLKTALYTTSNNNNNNNRLSNSNSSTASNSREGSLNPKKPITTNSNQTSPSKNKTKIQTVVSKNNPQKPITIKANNIINAANITSNGNNSTNSKVLKLDNDFVNELRANAEASVVKREEAAALAAAAKLGKSTLETNVSALNTSGNPDSLNGINTNTTANNSNSTNSLVGFNAASFPPGTPESVIAGFGALSHAAGLPINDNQNGLLQQQVQTQAPKKKARTTKKVYTIDEIPVEYREKPNISYSILIAECLKAKSTERGMSLGEIYKAIQELYPYYFYCPDGWQSSVRHNLSLNKSFMKVSKEGKGWLWGLDEEFYNEKEKLKKKQQESSGLANSNLHTSTSGISGSTNTTGQNTASSGTSSSSNTFNYQSYQLPATTQPNKPIGTTANTVKSSIDYGKPPHSSPSSVSTSSIAGSPGSIQAQLAANRAQVNKPSYTSTAAATAAAAARPKIATAAGTTPTAPASGAGTAATESSSSSAKLPGDTMKALSYMQQELIKLTKNRKMYDKDTTTAILTQALAMTIAQVNQVAKSAGIKGSPLLSLIEKDPQHITKILTAALNAATIHITKQRGLAPPNIPPTKSSSPSPAPLATPSPTATAASPKPKPAETNAALPTLGMAQLPKYVSNKPPTSSSSSTATSKASNNSTNIVKFPTRPTPAANFITKSPVSSTANLSTNSAASKFPAVPVMIGTKPSSVTASSSSPGQVPAPASSNTTQTQLQKDQAIRKPQSYSRPMAQSPVTTTAASVKATPSPMVPSAKSEVDDLLSSVIIPEKITSSRVTTQPATPVVPTVTPIPTGTTSTTNTTADVNYSKEMGDFHDPELESILDHYSRENTPEVSSLEGNKIVVSQDGNGNNGKSSDDNIETKPVENTAPVEVPPMSSFELDAFLAEHELNDNGKRPADESLIDNDGNKMPKI